MTNFNSIATANGFTSKWQIDLMGLPHAYQGVREVRIIDPPRIISVTLQGNTWLDLWRATDRAIREWGNPNANKIAGFIRVGKYSESLIPVINS